MNLSCQQSISLSLCYWTIWTNFPSGGQREDQHKVHWAMRLRPNNGTLMERFAAQNIPCSLYWDLTFERLPVSDDLASQLTDCCVHEYDYRYLFLRISLFSVVSLSGCLAASDLSCFTKTRAQRLTCSPKKKKSVYTNMVWNHIFPSHISDLNSCSCGHCALLWVKCSC